MGPVQVDGYCMVLVGTGTYDSRGPCHCLTLMQQVLVACKMQHNEKSLCSPWPVRDWPPRVELGLKLERFAQSLETCSVVFMPNGSTM